MTYSRDYPNNIVPKGSKVVECLDNDDKELKRILSLLSSIGSLSLFGSKRNCVLHAANDSSGNPSYLKANGLVVSIDGGTIPAVVTFAGGYDANGAVDKVESITDLVAAWTLPPNGTYYLYIDKDMSTGLLSYGYTAICDTYVKAAPVNPVLDQCYFNLVDMKMYHYNSSAWEQKLRVFVAKAVTAADATTLTIYPFTSRTTASNFIQHDGNGNLQAVDLAGALTQFSASKFIGTFKGDIVGNADTATKALAADKCTGNADTATKATQDKNGADIVDTYFPKSGGTISGDITANTVYSNNWFRSYGDNGWFNETHGGGWYMSDDTWIRAWNNKSVWTPQKMQADGGFYGALHGTADSATNAAYVDNDNTHMRFHWNGQAGQPTWVWGSPNDGANSYVYNPVNFDVHSAGIIRPLSGDANYKLAYTADGQRTNAGEWGRVVMRYDPNGQTYGVRCDRADYADSAGSVSGWSVDTIKRNLGGRNQPTLTALIDWTQTTQTVNSSSYGCIGTSGQDIHLKQSWKNFDRILVKSWHGGAWLMKSTVWDKWELEQLFNSTGMIDLVNGVSINYYIYASNQGTTAHPLSTDTIWYRYDSNCYIQEIYGVNY